MIKAIIFDFDGTITDSVNIKTEAFAELYRPYGDDVVENVVGYHLLHGGLSRFDKFKYFHKEFLNLSLNEAGIQELANMFSKLVIDKVVNAPYIPGAFEFISNNYNAYDMYISTGTPTDEIIEIIDRKSLTKYIKDIKGSPESKVDHVKQILSENSYLKKETVFVGDSDSDKEAAVQNNISFIAVMNGNKFHKEKFNVKDLVNLNVLLSGRFAPA